MQFLVIGHSMVVSSNRSLWNTLAQRHQVLVDLLFPEKWTSNLINNLKFTPDNTTDAHINRIFSLRTHFTGNGSFYFYEPLKFLALLRHKKYDAIIINQETWSLSLTELSLLVRLSINNKTPIYVIAAQNIKKSNLYILRHFEKIVTKNVRRILYCSDGVRQVIIWKGINIPCTYFPLSYSQERFKYNLKREDPSRIRIGYLGRLAEEKGILLLLDAYKKLQDEGVGVSLSIAGNGPLADIIKHDQSIKFLGIIPHSLAHTFYQEIDIFVLPSQTRKEWKEQFGRVIIEAAASGCLVIGSSSGSIPEVMGKIQMPYIFREDSISDLVDVLKTAIKDYSSSSRETLRDRAIESCIANFSEEAVADLIISIITKDI